jgi:hypothetical protein
MAREVKDDRNQPVVDPVDEIYSLIEEELRNQYSVGYTPERGGAPEGGYHKIKVATKQKGLLVQSREGYYAT